ncbi:HAMP domain-containing protein [Aeribacillus sp. FSL M8-0254]|uniref:HAMP domain-containing protein n=1 Tax=Aeribacillus sp. FSL M8-0254 TaxID=2954577 RepID=UPI0030F6B6B0
MQNARLSTLMFFFLHEGIVESRVNEELSSLLARGNSHSSVLAKSFDNETLSHVVLMESESKTDIVVTNKQGNVLGSSDQLQLFEKYLSEHSNSNIPKEGKVIEDNWEKEPYIVTISPISNTDEISGFVYMFQNTTSIHLLIQKLNEHFILTGWISVILTIIIIIFLSRGITKPLIKMKEATHQISKGDFTVTLPVNSNDELGELAHSIQKLAIDLNYLKKERNEFLARIVNYHFISEQKSHFFAHSFRKPSPLF